MAEVRIPVDRFVNGRVPSVCATTGECAEDRFAFVATGRPDAVVGFLPLSPGAVARLRSLQRATFAALFFAAVALPVAAVSGSPVVGAFALSSLVAGVGGIVVTARRTVRARLHDGEVRLRHVHPTFVLAAQGPTGRCASCPGVDACQAPALTAVGDTEAHADAGEPPI